MAYNKYDTEFQFIKHVFYPLTVGAKGNKKIAANYTLLTADIDVQEQEVELEGIKEKATKLEDNTWTGDTTLVELVNGANDIYNELLDKTFSDITPAIEKIFKAATGSGNTASTINPLLFYADGFELDSDAKPTDKVKSVGDQPEMVVGGDDFIKCLIYFIKNVLLPKDPNFYWSIRNKAPEAVAAFKRTAFGKALDKEGLIHAPSSVRSKKGPLGSQCRGILNSIDENGKYIPIYITTGKAYKIQDRSIVVSSNSKNQKKVTALVMPRSAQGVGANPNSNKIELRAQNNFDQASIIFDNLKDAEAVMNTLQTANPNNHLTVFETKVDSRGYLKVNTDLGPMLIAAKDFNEKLFLDDGDDIITEDVEIAPRGYLDTDAFTAEGKTYEEIQEAAEKYSRQLGNMIG